MTDAIQEAVDSEYEARIEREAEAAAKHLSEGQQWSHWLAIGRLMAIGRNKAMLRSGTNEPVGARYNKAFAEWLDARQWLRVIDKATRSHAMWCVDHVEELERLRQNMGATKRDNANHPTTMRRHWERTQREGEKDPAEKKEPRSKALERELEATAAERDKWKRKAEMDGSLFDLKQDPAPLIAKVIVSHVTPYKVGEILKALTVERDRLKAVKKQAG
jgi:hypothetical protein